MIKKAALTKIKTLLSDHCNNLLPNIQIDINAVKNNIDQIMGESKEQQQESKGSVTFSWQDRDSNDLAQINTLLRNKLLSIFNSPILTTSIQDQESAYSAIHASLLILARYWPLESPVINNIEFNDQNRILSIEGYQFHYNNIQQWFIKQKKTVNPGNNHPVNERDGSYMIYHVLRLVRLNGEISASPSVTRNFVIGFREILLTCIYVLLFMKLDGILSFLETMVGTLSLLYLSKMLLERLSDQLQRAPLVLPTSDPNPLATQILEELVQYERTLTASNSPSVISSSAQIQETLEATARLNENIVPPTTIYSISPAPAPQQAQRLLRFLNKSFGALFNLFISFPWILLATTTTTLTFLDPLIRRNVGKAIIELKGAPFKALIIFSSSTFSTIKSGWHFTSTTLLLSAPTRLTYFFKHKLGYGLRKGESLRNLFRTSAHPEGMDELISPGFFGDLALKFFSLTCSMEIYIAYTAGAAYAHNDINIYYTEEILGKLKTKYGSLPNKTQDLANIKAYSAAKKVAAENALKQAENQPTPSRPDSEEIKNSRIQNAKEELTHINASIRCINRLEKNKEISVDINESLACPSIDVLCYVWTAIEKESRSFADQKSLKEKLTLVLYQIQRGFNIASGDSSSTDLSECPTGSLGLIVRVIADEGERMPGSTYTAKDPSPANLSVALKANLDLPFISSTGIIKKQLYSTYQKDPGAFKHKKAEEIKKMWKGQYGELLKPKMQQVNPALSEESIDTLIDAGIEAWEPPDLNR